MNFAAETFPTDHSNKTTLVADKSAGSEGLEHPSVGHSSGRFTYDPSKCSPDAQGMVYFALGRRVFGQPMNNLLNIAGNTWAEAAILPLAPDSTEQLGCFRHPIQAAAFTVRFSASPDIKQTTFSKAIDNIPVTINLSGITIDYHGLFDLLCVSDGVQELTNPGFVSCHKKNSCGSGIAYQTIDYRSPDGKTIAVSCRGRPLAPDYCENPKVCSLGYALHSDLAIAYDFVQSQIPISGFVVMDRELRQRIAAAEVKDYPWQTGADAK